jgi:hypothetical protein
MPVALPASAIDEWVAWYGGPLARLVIGPSQSVWGTGSAAHILGVNNLEEELQHAA